MFLGTKVAEVEIANFQVKRFVESIDNATTILPADAGSLADVDIRAGQGTFATFSDRTTNAAEQVPFNNVLVVDINTTGSFLSQIRAGWLSDFDVAENSFLTVETWLRTDDAPFNVRLQLEQSPAVNRRVFREDLSVTNQWTKHEFTVTTRQASTAGAPISGATVNIDQIEHSYGFGNILKTEFISDIAGGQASDPASQRHAAIASRLFNTITIANGIRWVPWTQSRARGIDTPCKWSTKAKRLNESIFHAEPSTTI